MNDSNNNLNENQQIYEDLSGQTGETVVKPKKTMNSGDKFILAMFLLIVIGMIVIGYFFIRSFFYTPSVRNDQMATSTSTTVSSTLTTSSSSTTTSTTVFREVTDINSFDDYLEINKSNKYISSIIDFTNSYNYIDLDMNNKCSKDGDNVSFEINGNTVKYSCKRNDYDMACTPNWTGTISINDKFKKNYESCIECHNERIYSGPKGYISTIDIGCVSTVLPNTIEFFDVNGNSIAKSNYSNFYSPNADGSDSMTINPVIKDNKVYFVVGDYVDKFTSKTTTCRLKYIDLNLKNPTIVDTGFSLVCASDGQV